MSTRNVFDWDPNQLAAHYTPDALLLWVDDLCVKYRHHYLRDGHYPASVMRKIEVLLIAKLYAEANRAEKEGIEKTIFLTRHSYRNRPNYNWEAGELATHYSLTELVEWMIEQHKNVKEHPSDLNFWHLSCLREAIKLKITVTKGDSKK